MEPHSDSSEPQVRDISTEDSENQNNHAVDVLELGESPDSAWTPLSTSNTTFDSSQPEMLNEEAECVDTKDDNLPCVLTKTKPKHKWYAVKELGLRSFGLPCHKSIENIFNSRCHGSLRFVHRLQLAYKMDCHNGCVNALHFNSSGTRLVSGSDDLNIIVWDWSLAKPLLNYDSGHRGNVFQAKFLPLCGDMHIVSCARDGHIRLAELTPSGAFHSTRRLGLHRGPAHKLALLPDTPHVFLTAGEDAAVLEVDVRQSKPNK